MLVILSLFFILTLFAILGSLFIFHNTFVEIMPFSFSTSVKKLLFFFFAYFGLFIFILSWGLMLYLFYVSLDYFFSLSFIASCFAFILFFIFALFFAAFFVEVVNYQFTLNSYWYNENSFLFFVSKCFCIVFLIFSFSSLPFLISLSFPSLLSGCFFRFISSVLLSLLYCFWLISFSNHFLFNRSFFLC